MEENKLKKINVNNKIRHYNFRVNEKDYEKIRAKIQKSKLTTSEYLLKTALDKDITVIDGIEPIIIELRKIGNNLNQLTRLCHQGQITCLELNNFVREVGKVWQLLNLLIQKQT